MADFKDLLVSRTTQLNFGQDGTGDVYWWATSPSDVAYVMDATTGRVQFGTEAGVTDLSGHPAYVSIIQGGGSQLGIGEDLSAYARFACDPNGVLDIDCTGSTPRIVLNDTTWIDSTTAGQLRIRYDASNYIELDVASDGTTSLDLIAGASLLINDDGLDVDTRMESVNNADMFHLDAAEDAVGINFTPVTAAADVGGVLQVGTHYTAGSALDTSNKGLYIRTNETVAGAADAGTWSSFRIDFDYDFNNGGGFFLPLFKIIDVDIDLNYTAGTDLSSGSQPIRYKVAGDSTIKLGSAGTPNTVIGYEVETARTANGPTDGYVNFRVANTGSPSVVQVGTRFRNEFGGSAQQIGMQSIMIPDSGASGELIAVQSTYVAQNTLARVIGLDFGLTSGTPPSADLIMGVRANAHILARNSLVAADRTDPAAATNDKVSFTDGTANVYAEDNCEIDGILYVDGSLREVQSTITGNTTLDDTDRVVYCDTDSAAITVTLPALASADGQVVEIKNIGSSSNNVTIDGNGAETVEGSATLDVLDGDSVTLRADNTGSDWRIT